MKRILLLLLCLSLTVSLFGCASRRGKPYIPSGDALEFDEDYTGPIETKPKEETQEQSLTLSYNPKATMNPITCTDYTNRVLFSLIYQSLFVVDRNYKVEPMLCSQYSVSEDMLSYTFYIEQATFSDGTILTIEDVLASLEAAKASDYYGGRFTHIKEMAISPDGGLTIKLDTAYENLPILLDIPIIKASEIAMEQPVGTGPYALNSAASSLVRRTDWWCQAELVAKARTIALMPGESATQIRDQFQFESLDLVCADPGSDKYADYRCDYELWDSETGIFLYLAGNKEHALFSNAQVRSAMTFAIDRDKLVDTYYRGFARSATLPASPQSPYYSQNLADRYAFDMDKFKQAVEQAGVKGTKVEIMVNSDDSLRVRVARDIAKMLTDGGLNATTREVGGQAYRDALYYRTFDMYLGQTRLSPNMDLSAFFYLFGSLSYGSVNDTAAYELCKDALENQGNYYTLHQMVMDNGLICPILVRSYAVYATRGLLTDLTPSRDNVFYYSLGKRMEDARIA